MQLIKEENRIVLQDYLRASDLPQLAQCLEGSFITQQVWECADLDIEDGAAMAGLTSLLKNALSRGVALTLIAPPQLLMHNLYRVGFYPHPLLVAIDIRREEAYS